MCVCVCVRVCVRFLHDNSKNRSKNMKLEYTVVYENSLDKFDIEHLYQGQGHRWPSKVFPFTTIQNVMSYNSTLVQARKFILSMHVHLIPIYKIYEYGHA